MKTSTIVTAVSFVAGIMLPLCSNAQVRVDNDEKLRETQVAYELEHEDGSKENVVVKYEAQLKYKVWQTGSASKFPNHPVDDRKCHVSLNARVFRRAYVLTHSGVQAPIEDYQAIYAAQQETDRGADNPFEALTYHQTCGQVNLFSAKIEGAKGSLVKQFDLLIGQDDDKARERLKSMLVGKSIRQVKAEEG